MTSVVALAPQFLIDIGEAILRFFHDEAGFGWGAAIIGLTVVVRLAILPLTFKQVRGMQALQRLQPEMKRLQERHKDDKERLREETMKLWQEHQVNPMASCLPLLLQLPFFIALFDLLRGDAFREDIRGEESFLFIPDLAEPAAGVVLVALIVLFVATFLGSSLVTMVSADKNQRRIMLALPFIFIPAMVTLPSGMFVYWITTNVWTVGQQLFVKKFLPAPEPVAPSDGDGKKDPAKAVTPAPAAAAVPERGGGRRGLLEALGVRSEARGEPDGGEPPAERAPAGRGSSERPAARARSEKRPQAPAASGDGEGAPTGADGRPRKAPPPSPRRRKRKRSGRRR